MTAAWYSTWVGDAVVPLVGLAMAVAVWNFLRPTWRRR